MVTSQLVVDRLSRHEGSLIGLARLKLRHRPPYEARQKAKVEEDEVFVEGTPWSHTSIFQIDHITLTLCQRAEREPFHPFTRRMALNTSQARKAFSSLPSHPKWSFSRSNRTMGDKRLVVNREALPSDRNHPIETKIVDPYVESNYMGYGYLVVNREATLVAYKIRVHD